MTSHEDLNGSDSVAISHELLADCLQRITDGDPQGSLDLATFWIGHVLDRDPVIELGIIEGLLRQSAQLGSREANDHLMTVWPNLRPILEKRLKKLQGSGGAKGP
ncbi:MAG: hypothetical protein V4462_15485 [Pseudomonadota bacterium]